MDQAASNKAICFNCRFIQAGCDKVVAGRCPNCGYPLILNTGPVALAAEELEQVFRLLTSAFGGRRGNESLPGINVSRKRRRTRKVPLADGPTEPLPKIDEPQKATPPPVRATRPAMTRKVGRVLDARRPQAQRRRWLLA
jgi:hypothetical protein